MPHIYDVGEKAAIGNAYSLKHGEITRKRYAGLLGRSEIRARGARPSEKAGLFRSGFGGSSEEHEIRELQHAARRSGGVG